MNPILALKRSFQISFNFNFDKAKFMWISSITSNVYNRIIRPLCQKRKTFFNTKESETKKEHEK